MPNLSKFIRGWIDGGKLVVHPLDVKLHDSIIHSFENKEVLVSIKRAYDTRTLAENRYYWGVIVKLVSDEMGIIPDEAHELLKGLFLKVGIEFKGKRYEAIKSTASLSIKDFEDYCEKCRNWGATELNCVIPEPGQINLDL